MIPRRQGIWEIDFFYFPHRIQEKDGRPYYPYVILWIEHYSGFILNHHLAKPTNFVSEFPEQFLKLVENIESLPQEILVKREETFKLLEPLTSKLGIKLRRIKRLMALEKAQNTFLSFSSGENRNV